MSLGAVTFYVWAGVIVGLLVAQFVQVRRSSLSPVGNIYVARDPDDPDKVTMWGNGLVEQQLDGRLAEKVRLHEPLSRRERRQVAAKFQQRPTVPWYRRLARR